MNWKLMKHLVGLFTEHITWEDADKMPLSFEEAKRMKKIGLMSQGNICMIVPFSQEAYTLLLSICNDANYWSKRPKLDYTESNIAVSHFTTEYLRKIFAITTEEVILKLKNDFPLSIKLEVDGLKFEFILAPRIADTSERADDNLWEDALTIQENIMTAPSSELILTHLPPEVSGLTMEIK